MKKQEKNTNNKNNIPKENKNNKNFRKDHSDNIEIHEPISDNYLSPILDKLSKINYSAINSSMISFANTLSNINTSINPIVSKVATANYSAISNTMFSFADILSSVTTSISPIIEKFTTINYSAISSSMLSFADTLSSVTTSISPIIEKVAAINYSAISSSILSLEKQLSKLSIDKPNFENFIENFQSLSASINVDNFNLDDISPEDTLEVQTSSLELIEKIATGTLDYSDVKNNRPQVYAILILKFLLTFIIGYILTKGADYIVENNNPYNNSSNGISLHSQSTMNLKIITVNVLNIRKEPNTKSDIIGKLTNFDIVKVINEQPYWFEIEYIDLADNSTKTGWIAKRYTTNYFDTLENYLEYFSD